MKEMVKVVKKKTAYIIIGVITGVIWFGIIWGYGTLNITNVDWLKSGDNATSFFGWMFYKNSSWSFPIGLSEGVTYPFPLSIIYTDSIPIFALLFKILSPIFPEVFQYHGLWILFCIILESIIGSLIVRYARMGILDSVCINSLFILQTCMIGRAFRHTALASQWIILLAAYIWIDKNYFSTWKRKALAWSIALILTTLIHMYFIPMVVILMLGSLIEDSLRNINNLIHNIGIFVIACICGFFSLFIMGAMSGNTLISGGLGYYCMNLNALINGGGYSKIMPALPLAVGGQDEGRAYLGFGVIVLMLLALICLIFIKNRFSDKCLKIDWQTKVSVLFVVTALVVLALGTVVSFNDRVFFKWTYPRGIEDILKIFRSSGRMIWPVCYMIIIGASYILSTKMNRRFCSFLLAACVAIQIYDLSAYLRGIHQTRTDSLSYDYVGVRDEIWDKIAESGYEHIQFMYDNKNQFEVINFAIENNMTVSNFFASRKDNNGIYKYMLNVAESLNLGLFEEDTIYICDTLPHLNENAYVYYADSYYIATGFEISGMEQCKYRELAYATEFVDYFLELSRLEDCIVIFTACDEASNGLTEEMVDAMKKIGLMDFREHFRDGYIAVLDNQKLIAEEFKKGVINETVTINDLEIQMVSGWEEDAVVHSVMLNNVEYARRNRGINILVYDKSEKRVISNVTFDTYADGKLYW